VVLLGALRGSQEAGVYAAADRFLISGNLLAFALYGAAFPAFSAMTDLVHRHRVVIQTIRTGILLSAGGAAVLFIFAPELISLTYRFTESVALLRILSLSVPGVIVNSILGSALFALHRERLIATVLGVTCAANIVLNCVSIPLFGATGSAVISVLTEYGFMGVYGVVFVQEARRMPAR
jgi:O-antigen/teichoic acid export membrane protein